MQVAINAKDKTAEALQSKNLELVNYNSFPAKDEILHTKQRYLRDKKEVKHSEIDFFLYLKGRLPFGLPKSSWLELKSIVVPEKTDAITQSYTTSAGQVGAASSGDKQTSLQTGFEALSERESKCGKDFVIVM